MSRNEELMKELLYEFIAMEEKVLIEVLTQVLGRISICE